MRVTKEPLTMDQRTLAGKYMKLARKIAAKRVNPFVSPEDRLQDAYDGLMDAARGFKPERGVDFSTYARHRIRGAIIDAERLRSATIRTPRTALSRGERGLKVFQPSDADCYGCFVAPATTPAIDDRDEVETAMACLSDRERHIVKRYFLDGVLMKQVGVEVGLREPRVSQILSDVLPRLRERLSLAYAKGA